MIKNRQPLEKAFVDLVQKFTIQKYISNLSELGKKKRKKIYIHTHIIHIQTYIIKTNIFTHILLKQIYSLNSIIIN